MKKISFTSLIFVVLCFVFNSSTRSQTTPTPIPSSAQTNSASQTVGCTSDSANSGNRKTYLVGASRKFSTDPRIVGKVGGTLIIPRGQTERAKQLKIDHDNYANTQIYTLKSNLEEWKKMYPNPTAKQLAEVNDFYKTAMASLTDNPDVKKKVEQKRWDWRENGIDVGKTINQGTGCNTCWAFVASDVASTSLQKSRLEGEERINFPFFGDNQSQSKITFRSEPVSSFVQDLLNCMPIETESICNFGWHGTAFDFMVYEKGIPLSFEDGSLIYDVDAQKDIIYRRNYMFGRKFSCNPNKGFRKAVCWNYLISKPDQVPSVAELKTSLIEHGPIAAGIFFDDCFRDYRSGIFNEKNGGDNINHVVLLIGWDDSKQAWLIKNSYGNEWGENGFAWIKYGSNNIGMYAAWMDVAPKKYSSSFYDD
jgi:Papain family cysteine protease